MTVGHLSGKVAAALVFAEVFSADNSISALCDECNEAGTMNLSICYNTTKDLSMEEAYESNDLSQIPGCDTS